MVFCRIGVLLSVVVAGLAVIGCGGGATSTDPPADTTPNAAPTNVKLVEVSSQQPGQMSVSWLPAGDDTTSTADLLYQVHASEAADFSPSAVTLKSEVKGTLSSVLTGLNAGARYAVRLVAIDKQGASTTSTASSIVVADTDVTIQPGVSVRQAGSSEIAQINAGEIILNAGAAAPAVGQIIAGADGSGFLRRVSSVENLTNGTVQVRTSAVSLNEVVRDVKVSSTVTIAGAPTGISSTGSTQKTIQSATQAQPAKVQWAWPETGFSLSSTLASPTGTGVIQTGKTIAAANIDASSKIASGGDGAYAKFSVPDTVAILSGTEGDFSATSKITSKYFGGFINRIIGGSEIPVAVCKTEVISSELPAGVVVSTTTIGTAFKAVSTSSGEFQAAQAAKHNLHIDAKNVQAKAEPFKVVIRLYVDEAQNKCTETGRTLIGWAETVDVEFKVAVASTPNFPVKERKTIAFDGGFKVEADVDFTFDPQLEAEVDISGGDVRGVRLEVKARAEFDQYLNISANAGAHLNVTKNLIGDRKFVKVFMAGPVPIVMSGTFAVDMRVEGDATGAASINESVKLSIEDMLYGMTYMNRQWATSRGARPSYSIEVKGNSDAEVKLKISLLPKLNVSFYEALTGRLVVEPYMTAEAGLHGQVGLTDANGNISTDVDYWLTKANLYGGIDAWLMADLSVLGKNIVVWPSGAAVDDYNKYQKIELLASVRIAGLPELAATFDLSTKYAGDSRVFLVKLGYVNVANPLKGIFGTGPDSLIPFKGWLEPRILVENDDGYEVLPIDPAKSGEVWIRFKRAKKYNVRISGFSALGAWARQVREVEIDLSDYNGNGIPDLWESIYGISGSSAGGAQGDPDMDGLTNFSEWQIGKDPMRRDSGLPRLDVSINFASNSIPVGQSTTLSWSSVGASSCVATGAWSGGVETSGTRLVKAELEGDFSYGISCSGEGGSVAREVKLNVSPWLQLPAIFDPIKCLMKVHGTNTGPMEWRSIECFTDADRIFPTYTEDYLPPGYSKDRPEQFTYNVDVYGYFPGGSVMPKYRYQSAFWRDAVNFQGRTGYRTTESYSLTTRAPLSIGVYSQVVSALNFINEPDGRSYEVRFMSKSIVVASVGARDVVDIVCYPGGNYNGALGGEYGEYGETTNYVRGPARRLSSSECPSRSEVLEVNSISPKDFPLYRLVSGASKSLEASRNVR